MISHGRNSSFQSPHVSRGRVYRYPNPDYAIDVAWLKKILPESYGQIYFSSGEANYKVYSEVENEMRLATDRNGATIHFLTGPIISVPDHETETMPQEERECLNLIIRMAKEKKIILYPTRERLSKHYRVFKEMKIVSAFEAHDLCKESDNLWLYYDDELETRLRIKDFEERIGSTGSINGELSKYFVFLNETEIQRLKKWAKDRNIETMNVNLQDCRRFWAELES
jgi:hypothetical protein